MQLNMQQPPELTNCISIQEFIINKYYNKKKVPVTIVLLTVTGALLTNL